METWMVGGIVGALTGAWTAASIGVARRDLNDWAKWHGYSIKKAVFQWWGGGYGFRRARGHRVFDLTVVDKEGTTRQAWVWVGHWYLGAVTRQVHVEWRES